MQDNAGNFHVHGHIYELHYPYWSYYGFLGWGYNVAGDPWYDSTCTDTFGNPYTCTTYYYATTTYPYLTARGVAPYPGPVCYGNEDPWRWFGW